MILSEFLRSYRDGVKSATGVHFSVSKLAGLLGVSQDRLTKWEGSKVKNGVIPSAEDDRSRLKMFFGMDNLENIPDTILKNAIERYPNPANDTPKKDPERPTKKIPIIGEAVAGTEEEMTYTDLDHTYQDQYIDVGDLLRDSESAFIVYGNSMTPAYPSGCVLGIRHNADSFIQPGETYLIVTKSNKIFKRLFYNEDRSAYVCYSDNTMMYETGPMKGRYAYPPFEISFRDVISVYDVIGMIKRNRNTGIIQRQK